MTSRDIVSRSVMIGACAENITCVYEAHSIFLQMQQEGYVPDALITSEHVKFACEWIRCPGMVEGGSFPCLKGGQFFDVRVANSLMPMYAKYSLVVDARQVFHV